MSDLDLELKSCSTGSGANYGFGFQSSVHPNALKFIPNFDFGEEINPGLGSLKNSSFVKSPNFRQ